MKCLCNRIFGAGINALLLRCRRAGMATVLAMATLLAATQAHASVNVVATLPWLADIVAQVGGDDVTVRALAGPLQDPHFVDAKPSFLLHLHRADLLVVNGLELENGWLPKLLVEARNPAIQPGRNGYLDASTAIDRVLEVGGAGVDRRMGDVHPSGSPHYAFDPRRVLSVAAVITQRLQVLDPNNAAAYAARGSTYDKRLREQIARWEATMAPYRGAGLVSYHRSTAYLLDWLGLESHGYIEPLPGIAPSAHHLAELILSMRSRKTAVIFTEAWYMGEPARLVAEKTGATLAILPGDVGAAGIDSYETFIATIVERLDRAYRQARP